MQKKYILLSIVLVLLLSGCKGNYNIEINKDLSIVESFTINGDDRFALTGYTPNSMFDTLINTYHEYYNPLDASLYEKSSNGNNLRISFNKKYNSLNEYKDSFYIKKIYTDGLSVTKDEDNFITLKNNGNMENFWVLLPGVDEEALFEEIRISIKVPFVVISNNADLVDKNKNIYTWIYDYQESDKNLLLTFNENKEFVSSKNQIIKNVLLIVGIIIIVGLIGYFGYKYYKKKDQEINEI